MGQRAMRRLKGRGRRLRRAGELGEELDLRARRWRIGAVERESTDELKIRS